MKKIFLFLFLFGSFTHLFSQENQDSVMNNMRNDFDVYRKKSIRDFDNFRDKANADFAEYMLKDWKNFQAFKGIPAPKAPDPVTPPMKKDPQEKPEDHLVPQGKIEPLPEPQKQPLPVEPIPVNPTPEQTSLKFKFFNSSYSVVWNDSLKFTINSLSGENLANTWKALAGKSYNEFLSDCINLRSKLSLCDWAYVELLQQITEQIYGSSKTNEAVFLQMYVLSQTGYKVRIAQADKSQLILLVCTDFEMYNRMYMEIGDVKFYMVNSDAKQLQVLNEGFPKEQPVSLRIEPEPQINRAETEERLFASERFPVESVKTGVNKSLIDFYNSYPHCNWKVYANTPLSSTVKNNLYPSLKYAIKGKSETEAANMLINFVQTAFRYKTDEEQFGYERPFFPEEVFYYPYSDCEDRAFLYTILVRDLLHLKVVLLHYPNHLATAVHFDENVKGDYLMVNNEKFLVCDPTYIGASIGDAMPQFKNVAAEVVELSLGK